MINKFNSGYKINYIGYTSFLIAAIDIKKWFDNKQKLKAIFNIFDIDNSGFISINNIYEKIRRQGRILPKEEIESYIKQVDFANTNQISQIDFIKIMKYDNI